MCTIIYLGTCQKLEYIVVYEKSSDDIEHCHIKVKVTVGFQVFPDYQLSAPKTQFWYKLGSMYVYLILIYKIYEYCHALAVFLTSRRRPRRGFDILLFQPLG